MATIETFNCGHPRLSWNIIDNTNGKRIIQRCRYCKYRDSMRRYHPDTPLRTFEQYIIIRINGFDLRHNHHPACL